MWRTPPVPSARVHPGPDQHWQMSEHTPNQRGENTATARRAESTQSKSSGASLASNSFFRHPTSCRQDTTSG